MRLQSKGERQKDAQLITPILLHMVWHILYLGTPGFGNVRQYFGWLIFIYKVKSKVRFGALLGEGVGL